MALSCGIKVSRPSPQKMDLTLQQNLFFCHFPDEWKAGLIRNLKFAFGVRLHPRNTAQINHHMDNFVGIIDFILLLFT